MQVIARQWKPFKDQNYLPALPFQANSLKVKFYKTRQHSLLMSTELERLKTLLTLDFVTFLKTTKQFTKRPCISRSTFK